MRRKLATLILAGMAFAHCTSVWALDAQSVQAYCDDVKKAAQDAQAKYILAYKPTVDPGKVFEDATTDCLNFIVNFQIGIPGPWDGLIATAKQALARACQAARSQFDKAVNDAVQSVNSQVSQVPGANVGTSTTTGGNSGIGASGSVKTDGGAAAQGAANKGVDKVFNILK